MLEPQTASAAPAFPSRRAYGALAIAASLFAVYVSAIPFGFEFVPWADAWQVYRRNVLTLGMPPVSRSNFAGNILLFVPIGFFAVGVLILDRERPNLPAALAVVLGWAGSVSLTAEFLQVFEPSRIPTVADVWAHALGTITGVAGWFLVGSHLTAWLRSASTRSRDDRVARVLGAYVLIWVVAQLAPFDITLSPGLIAARLRALVLDATTWRDPASGLAHAIWSTAATLLAAAPVGAAATIAGTGRGRRRLAITALASATGLVALVEAIQLLSMSRTPSFQDLLAGIAGVAAGVLATTRIVSRQRPWPKEHAAFKAAGVVTLWMLFMVAYHWQPFDFTFDTELARRKVETMPLVPLAGHFKGQELNALGDLLFKLCLALPLGVAAGWGMLGRLPGRVAYALWVIIAGSLFAAIETGQLFLPSRFPDVGDVVVAVLGSSLGVSIGRWIEGKQLST